MLAAAGLALTVAYPAAAQNTNIEHVRALIAQAQAGQGQPASAQPPVAAGTPFTTAGPRVDLPIEEAVRHAMEKNIDISVARITPRLTDCDVAGLEANYRLDLISAARDTRKTRQPSETTQGITAPTTSIATQWWSGIAQNLWKGGGNYAVNWTNSRLNSPSTVNTRSPQLNS